MWSLLALVVILCAAVLYDLIEAIPRIKAILLKHNEGNEQ